MRRASSVAVSVLLALASQAARAQPIVPNTAPPAPVVPNTPAPPPIAQAVTPAAPLPPPPEDNPAQKARKTLLTGVWLTAITHGAAWTLALALGPTDSTAWWLALPIAGPAVFGALTPCHGDRSVHRQCRTLAATGGGFWVAIQLGGFVCILAGLAELRRTQSVAVVPLPRGLALVGTF